MTLQVKIDGENLFPIPVLFDGNPLTVVRLAFRSVFYTGELPEGTVIELTVAGAPEVAYYEEPQRGLTACLIGEYLP